jgi:DeoR family ulaG and ulaABCDEF operon transcriptional repressor
MHRTERQLLILNTVERRGVLAVDKIARALKCSAATARRDIKALEARDLIVQDHGVVRRADDYGWRTPLAQPSFGAAEKSRQTEKRRIARAAAQMCADGQTVVIGGGTTTYLMAEHLLLRRMRVITNSFLLARRLGYGSRNTVILPAGKLYPEHHLILSDFEDSLTPYCADKMFVGGQGFSEKGLLERDPVVARSTRKLLNLAAQIIVLLDSSKIGKGGGIICCPPARVSEIITDDKIAAKTARRFAAMNIKMRVVAARGSDKARKTLR